MIVETLRATFMGNTECFFEGFENLMHTKKGESIAFPFRFV